MVARRPCHPVAERKYRAGDQTAWFFHLLLLLELHHPVLPFQPILDPRISQMVAPYAKQYEWFQAKFQSRCPRSYSSDTCLWGTIVLLDLATAGRVRVSWDFQHHEWTQALVTPLAQEYLTTNGIDGLGTELWRRVAASVFRAVCRWWRKVWYKSFNIFRPSRKSHFCNIIWSAQLLPRQHLLWSFMPWKTYTQLFRTRMKKPRRKGNGSTVCCRSIHGPMHAWKATLFYFSLSRIDCNLVEQYWLEFFPLWCLLAALHTAVHSQLATPNLAKTIGVLENPKRKRHHAGNQDNVNVVFTFPRLCRGPIPTTKCPMQ